jgi:hypothetical protein
MAKITLPDVVELQLRHRLLADECLNLSVEIGAKLQREPAGEAELRGAILYRAGTALAIHLIMLDEVEGAGRATESSFPVEYGGIQQDPYSATLRVSALYDSVLIHSASLLDYTARHASTLLETRMPMRWNGLRNLLGKVNDSAKLVVLEVIDRLHRGWVDAFYCYRSDVIHDEPEGGQLVTTTDVQQDTWSMQHTGATRLFDLIPELADTVSPDELTLPVASCLVLDRTYRTSIRILQELRRYVHATASFSREYEKIQFGGPPLPFNIEDVYDGDIMYS